MFSKMMQTHLHVTSAADARSSPANSEQVASGMEGSTTATTTTSTTDANVSIFQPIPFEIQQSEDSQHQYEVFSSPQELEVESQEHAIQQNEAPLTSGSEMPIRMSNNIKNNKKDSDDESSFLPLPHELDTSLFQSSSQKDSVPKKQKRFFSEIHQEEGSFNYYSDDDDDDSKKHLSKKKRETVEKNNGVHDNEDITNSFDLSSAEKKIRSELSMENERMQLEIQSLRSEIEKVNTERKMNLEELSSVRSELEKNISEKKEFFGEIEQEFICAVCQEIIVEPTTLFCSHTFCKSCIKEWLKEKRVCPVCRKMVIPSSKPIKNITLENLIEKYLKHIESEEKDNRKKRIIEKEQKEIKDVESLKELIKKTKEKNIQFLKITDIWNIDERHVFALGMKKYEGKARELYCELTGFTREFISKSSDTDILKACENIGLEVSKKETINPKSTSGQGNIDFDLTRDKLRDFLEGDIFFT